MRRRNAQRWVGAFAAAIVLIAVSGAAAKVPTALRILAIGESTTQGAGSIDGCGYRTELGNLLTKAAVVPVWTGPPNGGNPYNPAMDCTTGWRGNSTLEYLQTNIAAWLASDQPDAVIIMTGINNSAGVGLGLTGFETNYTNLIGTIRNWSPTVQVFAVMIPYSSAPWATNEVWANVGIIHATWAYPSRVFLVDPSGYPTRWTVDGIHPSDYGPIAHTIYASMATAYGLPGVPWGSVVLPGGSCRPGFERAPTAWHC